MATPSPIARTIEAAAVDRLRQFIDRHDDQSVFTLVEVSQATAMDPTTVERGMQLLSSNDRFRDPAYSVRRRDGTYGEIQWTVTRHDQRNREG